CGLRAFGAPDFALDNLVTLTRLSRGSPPLKHALPAGRRASLQHRGRAGARSGCTAPRPAAPRNQRTWALRCGPGWRGACVLNIEDLPPASQAQTVGANVPAHAVHTPHCGLLRARAHDSFGKRISPHWEHEPIILGGLAMTHPIKA